MMRRRVKIRRRLFDDGIAGGEPAFYGRRFPPRAFSRRVPKEAGIV
jgi:hypothetical protein